MATIQARSSRGQKYWYIVESRRINGKPRPIMLAYLGKAESLLKRLQNKIDDIRLKSYSHGAVAALLKIALELDVCNIINNHIKSSRHYVSEKPVRNNLTAGITFLLAAFGRVCAPTSKRGWYNWAKTTSLEYMLRCNFNKVDSRHFWDLMDVLPSNLIEKVEEELLRKAFKLYALDSSSLFFDTSNFFTYINTTNKCNTLAQRGRNKQKRNDLRQVGLAVVVTKREMIPLFHLTYQGNTSDIKVFASIVDKLKSRMKALKLDIKKQTLVFDRGNNSKANLTLLKEAKLYYVAALTPCHHKQLVNDAMNNFNQIEVNGSQMLIYRDKLVIWREERTAIVFISEKLKAGQIRGIYRELDKITDELTLLQQALANPRSKRREEKQLKQKIDDVITRQYTKNIVDWSLKEVSEGRFRLFFSINKNELEKIEERLGFRIIITNRHEWHTNDIINTYHGQANVEKTFKNLKNPYHLAITPQFHWTDQKIKVHYFICVLGYLLAAILFHHAKTMIGFKGSLNSLLNDLNNIRLATILEETTKLNRLKATYKLEEMSDLEASLMDCLGIKDFHTTRLKKENVGVYN